MRLLACAALALLAVVIGGCKVDVDDDGTVVKPATVKVDVPD